MLSFVALGHRILADAGESQPTARILARSLPRAWVAYGLERDIAVMEAVVRRAIVLTQVEEKRAPTASEPPTDRAIRTLRRAVEERIVEAYQHADFPAAREYCERNLAEAVAKYHQHYFLITDEHLRDEHLRDEHLQAATTETAQQLATYDGTQPLHKWIRRVAHREAAATIGAKGKSEPKRVERHGIDCLRDWLDLQARLVVERYVVSEMRANRRPHLATLNLIWTAQHVCQWHHAHYGCPESPHAPLNDIWATLLEPVPWELQERIFEHTSDVNERIIKGLHTFKGQSTLDTWRTSVLNNTLSTIAKRDRLRARNERSLYANPRTDDHTDGDDDHMLPIPDVRSSFGILDEFFDLQFIVAKVVRAFLLGREVEQKIIELRLKGMPAKEVAKECHVPSARVDRVYSEFKRRVREEYNLREHPAGNPPSA